ncbi:MAG TPA: ROK family protein [Bryobacteraceae bacterium]|jgi:predicted NBD/HSP70 family sugar kinase|nr:ROK family protein [Bryobacteraceae bacterium]
MAYSVGVVITERITVGAVSGNALAGELRVSPEDPSIADSLLGVPAESIVQRIVEEIRQLGLSEPPAHVGLGLPGIVRSGIVEDSPNLVQFKGVHIRDLMKRAVEPLFGKVPVSIFNDADVMAAGIAATRGHLDKLIRVWTLGNGIGFGRYPSVEGVWEAGHSVVSLDPKEQFCGCGGRGHLEGIMGQRSMRLRFMDLEPDEVFAQAEEGVPRCVDFVKLWHRALAAATATSIHLDGPGKFYVTGFNARFINVNLVNEYLHEMVKLSPLQGYQIEVVPGGENVATIGSAVNAERAARGAKSGRS